MFSELLNDMNVLGQVDGWNAIRENYFKDIINKLDVRCETLKNLQKKNNQPTAKEVLSLIKDVIDQRFA
jgi:hypothetical protein